MKVPSRVSPFVRLHFVKIQIAVVALMMSLICVSSFAQVNEGNIQGGVFDQSGGAIVGATVTVIDVARGISQPLTTGPTGQYLAVNLIPGTYTVRATATGFQTVEHANVVVGVGQTIRVDLTLSPGAQTQSVTVNAELPSIDTTDAVMGGEITNQAVNELPLNGRNFMNLMELRPGSVAALSQGDGTTNSGSFNGLRTQSNEFIVEGLVQFSADGEPIVNQQLSGGQGSILSLDAIQEFNIVENPKAEYGWKDGAVINVDIKSGTNDIHGTAFAFGRDGAWDAPNYFTGVTQQVALEQFGGTAGGRIIKNKLFWFADYEGQRINVATGATPTMPSDISISPTSQVSMVDVCNAIQTTGGTINMLSARLAGLTGIVPTAGNPNVGTGSCTVTPASSTVENVFPYNPTTSTTINPNLANNESIDGGLLKIDYARSEHHHFDGGFYRSVQASINYGSTIVAPQWDTLAPVTVPMYFGGWTWTPKTNWVNEFRTGYATIYSPRAGGDTQISPSSPWPTGYGINTGQSNNPLYGGFPTIKISPFNGTLGVGAFGGIRGPEGNLDFLDHVSYVHGNHSFKFGFEFFQQIFKGDTFKNSQGTISFSSLQNFLTGTVKNGASIFVGNAALNASNYNYAAFAQDDWRISKKVTLNLGLRYEYYTSPNEVNNFIGNFYPNASPGTPAVQQAGGPFAPLYHPDPWEFSPRLGLAWDLFGNGRTVLRAGASVIYAIPPIGDNIDVSPFGASFPDLGINNSGTAIGAATPEIFSFSASQINKGWNLAGPVFPVAGTGVSCSKVTPCAQVAVNPHMQTPFTPEYNVDVQHAFTNNFTVDVAYVGNHGFNELSRNNINEPAMGAGWNNTDATLGESPAAACIASAPAFNNCLNSKTQTAAMAAIARNEAAAVTFPQFPYLNYITYQSNEWYSSYNGLQITATERASHGLSFLASFTHDSAHSFMSGGGWTGPYSQDIRNVSLDYGPSDYNIKNNFTFSTTYNIPGIKSPAQLLKGWTVDGVVTLQGGLPWNPQDQTTDLQGTAQYADPNSPASQFWNYSGPTSAFRAGPHNISCFGNLSGCTPYNQLPSGLPTTLVGSVTVPTECLNAATAPYSGNASLTTLATAALVNLGCYAQRGGVLTPPAYGTVGNASRGIFLTQPFYNVDLAIAKNWTFKENYRAQFRAEFFNLFNRADFAPPKTVDPSSGLGFGASVNTPDVQGSSPVVGKGGARDIQLGLKLFF